MRFFVFCLFMMNLGSTAHAHAHALDLQWSRSGVIPKNLADSSIGGISGATFVGSDLFLISDHRQKPILWKMSVSPGNFTFRVLEETILGSAGRFDLEALAWSGGFFFFSNEGRWNTLGHSVVPPQIFQYGPNSRETISLKVPSSYLPSQGRGVQNNRSLEGLTVTPSGRWLYTVNEEELEQDRGQRIVRLNRRRLFDHLFLGEPTHTLTSDWTEWKYRLDAPARGSNGVSEILALDDERLLFLERGGYPVAEGWKSHARIYLVSTKDRIFKKTLVFDFKDLPSGAITGPLDNLEAMTFGPPSKAGRQLWVFADDNFRSQQSNQVYVFDIIF